MPPRRMLNNLPIRYKIVIACTALFIPFAILAGVLSYSVMRSALETEINSQLTTATEAVRNMVQTSVRLSIRNYLRAVSETDSDIVRSFYQRQLAGQLTEAEAKAQAAAVLLRQQIAKSGYIYCLDSSGTVTVHPEPGVLGRKLTGVGFIDEQVRRKNGYIEYDWQNPGDATAKPKALWMTYFAPWDWIISATAYRDEFDQVVNIGDFRESIQAFRFMGSGYSFVLDAGGDLIVHPLLQGENVFSRGLETPGELFKTMLSRRKGKLFYSWQNPGESVPRRKVVVFDHIPEVDWFVASAAYLDDLYQPIRTIRNIAILVGVLCLLGGGAVAMRISASITRPLGLLAKRFAVGATGDYSVRMEDQGENEIGQLSRFFNGFMEQLDAETRERKRLERQMIEADDQERIRVGQDLHDDLAPHLIGIEVLSRILHKKLQAQAPDHAPQAETIRALLAEATRKTRALARGLCPIHLGTEGLDFALREFAATVSDLFAVDCQVHGEERIEVPEAIAVHIYRIAQEAIQNAVKHAEAGQIGITLDRRDAQLTLEIRDDGKGFATAGQSGGMGLRIMQFRARIIGAELAVESRVGRGTTVRLRLREAFDTPGEGQDG